ncbi:MAG TPA: hypothetical protein VN605_06200 [Thermoanaerobaculia bacterium]|nr:hypothetical protein [Thermoanaerobaculia bacterium]
MPIERFLPQYDAIETHSIVIEAPREAVWSTLRSGNIGGSWIIKFLMGLRSIFSGLDRRAATQAITIEKMARHGFGILDEEPGREIVIGIHGRFWRPTGNTLPFDRESFAQPVPAGLARAAWNFTLDDAPQGTKLTTETRVLCGDAVSRRKFRRYWFFVRPFSGLIRIVMLRGIRRQVERARW